MTTSDEDFVDSDASSSNNKNGNNGQVMWMDGDNNLNDMDVFRRVLMNMQTMNAGNICSADGNCVIQ
jgi:hypothetical protein